MKNHLHYAKLAKPTEPKVTSAELEEQVKNFLAAGGEIKVVGNVGSDVHGAAKTNSLQDVEDVFDEV